VPNHLDQAKRSAAFVDQHTEIAALAAPATQRGILHALIDIAESLRAVRPFEGYDERAGLADLPLEAVGVDDEAAR